MLLGKLAGMATSLLCSPSVELGVKTLLVATVFQDHELDELAWLGAGRLGVVSGSFAGGGGEPA